MNEIQPNYREQYLAEIKAYFSINYSSFKGIWSYFVWRLKNEQGKSVCECEKELEELEELEDILESALYSKRSGLSDEEMKELKKYEQDAKFPPPGTVVWHP